METDWQSYCDAADLTVREGEICVSLGDDRTHRIDVTEAPDEFLIRAFVVRRADAARIPDLHQRVWARNRFASLVGFRIDNRGRLLGEAWLPKAGLTREEFQMYVRHLAIEADRFEYVLTGRDQE